MWLVLFSFMQDRACTSEREEEASFEAHASGTLDQPWQQQKRGRQRRPLWWAAAVTQEEEKKPNSKIASLKAETITIPKTTRRRRETSAPSLENAAKGGGSKAQTMAVAGIHPIALLREPQETTAGDIYVMESSPGGLDLCHARNASQARAGCAISVAALSHREGTQERNHHSSNGRPPSSARAGINGRQVDAGSSSLSADLLVRQQQSGSGLMQKVLWQRGQVRNQIL